MFGEKIKPEEEVDTFVQIIEEKDNLIKEKDILIKEQENKIKEKDIQIKEEYEHTKNVIKRLKSVIDQCKDEHTKIELEEALEEYQNTIFNIYSRYVKM